MDTAPERAGSQPPPAPPLTGAPPRGGDVALWARCCHPAAALAVTALTTTLAVSAGHHPGRCALIAAAVLTGQLSVGWSNDAADLRRDAAVGRQDKPAARGAVPGPALWAAASLALALSVPLSLACGVLAGGAHLLGVAAAWLYNLRLKRTPWSWLPYAVGFASLPALVTLSLPGGGPPAWWALTAGALLGVAAHFADVLPDLRDDLSIGVRGLPQRLGAHLTRLLMCVALVAATAVLTLAPPGGPTGAVALLLPLAAATCCFAALACARYFAAAPFVGAVLVATLDVGLLATSGASLG